MLFGHVCTTQYYGRRIVSVPHSDCVFSVVLGAGGCCNQRLDETVAMAITWNPQ